MSYNDYFGIYDNDYNMFTESSITGRYDYMDITEATQKFQIDVIDMLHEFTENVWITEATNVANGRRPYALFEAEGFWEKVKDMFRKAIAWIKDMYVKVKGWLLDKWEDAKKWWKTMGLSESDVKIGQDIYVNQVYDKPGVKVKISSSASESNDVDGKYKKEGAVGGLDVKIKKVDSSFMSAVMDMIQRSPALVSNLLSVKGGRIKGVKFTVKGTGDTEETQEYNQKDASVHKDVLTHGAISSSIDDFFNKNVYSGDSEKYYVIDKTMLDDAVDCLFKNRNNFISRIMNHERACTKVLENTLRKAQKYQSGDTEYKNTHDNNIDDEDFEVVAGEKDTFKTSEGKKFTVDTLSTQIRFNSDIVKKAIEAYRRYLSNSIAIVKRVMSNEKIKKVINAIKEGEKPATAYSKLNESYDPYWDNDYSYGYGGMESYMWS